MSLSITRRSMLAVCAMLVWLTLSGHVLAQDTFQVRVRVVDMDGEPVAGATVTVRNEASNRMSDKVDGTTDDGGLCVVTMRSVPGDAYSITASKPVYKSSKREFVLSTRSQKTVALLVKIERQRGVEIVARVLAEDDRSPVVGARVYFVDDSHVTAGAASGTTDPGGYARVFLTKGGNYSISVTHDNFFPSETEMSLNSFSLLTLEQTYTLKRKEKDQKPETEILVRVYGKGIDGTRRRLEGVMVRAELEDVRVGYTDSSGGAILKTFGLPGDETMITVSASGYISQRKVARLQQSRGIRSTDAEGFVEFNLEPETVILTVEVLEEKTNKPISTAGVSLATLDRSFLSGVEATNANGEAEFAGANGAPRGQPLRATVTHPDYEKRFSDIGGDQLTGASRRVVVFLKAKDECTSGACFTGSWSDDFGYQIKLDGGGSNVTGTFTKGSNKGVFTSGTYDAKTCKLTLTYEEPWKQSKGKAELTFSSDGATLRGSWVSDVPGYSVPQVGSWTISRLDKPIGGCKKQP